MIRFLRPASITLLAVVLHVAIAGAASAQWGTAQLLNEPSETAVKSARIAACKTGGFHAVYSNTSPWQIVYRRYQNGYLTPKKVVREGFVPNPAICEAGNGDIHLAWEDWEGPLEIGWAKSSDGGQTFIPFQEITNTGDTKHPHLAPFGPDDSPTVIMSYWQAVDKNLYWRQFNGSSWGTLNNMGQNADNEYEVFGICRSLQDGTIYRSYGTKIGGVLSVCYRRFNGSYWEPQVVVESFGFFSRHDIAVNPAGQVMVMWEGDNMIYTKLYTPGVGWGSTNHLESLSTHAALTAIPGSNDFYIVYTYDMKRIYGVRWSGGGWLARELISSGLPDAFSVGADVTAGPDGAVYACWEYWGSGNCQQFYNIRPGGPAPNSAIAGTVRDQYGAGISGVYVGSGPYATVSSIGGSYNLPVAAGTYTLSANKEYYTGQTVSNVTAVAGQTTPLDFIVIATAPGVPSGFTATGSNGLVRLAWTNPASGNFQGTMIRYKTTGYPTGPADGQLVCDRPTAPGQADNFIQTGLTNGITYYYAAFSHDDAGHYSPSVTVSATALNPSVNYVRHLVDGVIVDLTNKVVSANLAATDGCIYVQEPNRSAGIRINCSDTTLAVGDRVNVTGTLTTRLLSNQPAERQITSATVSKLSSGAAPGPMAMTCRAVGGAADGLVPGVRGGVGMNNMGLLVRITGTVTYKSGQYVYIDDGSGVENLYGMSTVVTGVMVKCPSIIAANVGDTIAVTGIVEGSVPNSAGWTTNRRYLHMRTLDDLTLIVYMPTTGTISGTVKDSGGVGIVGAAVATSTGGYSTTTTAGGAYTLSNIAPGTYSVTASKSGYTSQTASNVGVIAGQTTGVNFTINSVLGTVAGTVRTTTGAAIASATVTLSPGGYSATTGADGYYSVSNVPSGAYAVTASKAGYTSQSQNVSVTAGQTSTANFALQASLTEKLLNGNFEGGFFNSGWYGGWCANGWGFAWKSTPANNSFYCNSYNAGSPHNTVHLVQGKVDNFEVGIAQEITGLTPGCPYVFSAECFKTGGSYSTYIAVRDGVGYNSNMGTTAGTAFPDTTGAWVSQQVTGTVSSSGSVTVYLWVKRLSGATADIYFDNASFMGQ